ncbi:hypothetical protein D1831_00115 [Lactiplantibacillus garii]|uniref:DUF2334 domain-containing protein n=1 Tax=Lactiplantibacillus garii TaxID=2306423 RepID=A0A3R8QTG5_9LACO|nr:hypothetical protein [Lactiplantibacillus garii]RRK11778.1 hypothetical protein D1831_00115 [Lactiplantibacillus garii]
MKNHRALFRWLFVGLVLLMGLAVPGRVQAAQPVERVLLVYDSQNVANNDQTKVAAVQRILTGLHVQVKTEAAENYRSGQLAKYQGVVTLINWPQTALNNRAFSRDRARFKGIKLHIGPNLTKQEAQSMGVTPVKLYHQQLTLRNKQRTVHQLLPFSETMTALTKLPTKARTVGYLQPQTAQKRAYPYGTVVGRQGYLPYFSTGGYSLTLAMQTMATLFGHTKTYDPLLTITKVTPYSNLVLLNKLSLTLYRRGIPFAVSTTTVGTNANFKAYQRFAKVLRLIENRGGVIFLKTPVVGGVTASSGHTLDDLMNNYLIQFAQNQVYPVGISTPAFWNQDRVYRNYALKKANQILWLPNPATLTYAKQDNEATVFKNSIYGVAASSFGTVSSGTDLSKMGRRFAIPTALTFTMPNSETSLKDFEHRVNRMHYQWLNPATQMKSTNIVSGTATIGYQYGTYFLNGARTQVPDQPVQEKTLAAVKPEESWMNRFFKVQGNVLLIFFLGTFAVFGLFIFVGRKVYLNMFKRKG